MKKSRNSQGRKTLNSFEELRSVFGLKKINYQTKDKNKLTSQRENFENHHLCPVCNQPMKYIPGTNVMVCKNQSCKGIEREKIDDETEETVVYYEVPNHQLDSRGARIAYNIFKEEEK